MPVVRFVHPVGPVQLLRQARISCRCPARQAAGRSRFILTEELLVRRISQVVEQGADGFRVADLPRLNHLVNLQEREWTV